MHVFPLRRLAALAGGLRRSLPAAVLLALAALVPLALPISSAHAQTEVDLTGPALVSATVIFDGDQISLVFSEDLVIPASGIAAFLNTIAGSFSVTAAGSPLSVGRAIATGTSPHMLTLPVSPDIGQGQAVVVSYTDPTAGDDDVALEDAGGNETPSFATGSGGVPAVTNNSTVDLTGPALVSATVIFDGDQISLVFSEDLVIPASGIAAFLNTIAGSFSVTAAGSPLSVGRAIATGTSPHILTLPVSPDIGQGQAVVVSYTDPTAGDDDVALEDAGGNETPSFATGSGGVPAVTNNSTVDLTGPALVSATVIFDGDQISLVFSEDLVIPASGIAAFLNTIAGSFSVTAAGSPLSVGRAIATGTSPHILTLPVSPDIGQGQAVVVSYTDPTAGDDDVALEDAGGNETPSFATGSGGVPAVTNNSTVDLTGPALVSATVIFDGDQISLVFSEDLVIPASGIAAFLNTIAGSFSVTAAGSPLSVGRAIATGTSPHILTLPVSPDIGQGQAVVVSYTDPTAGDDDVALEDAGGNETPSFATGSGGVPAVTNNSTVDLTGPALVSATVIFDGDQISLVFSEDLVIPASGIAAFLNTIAGSFSVTAAGSPLSVGRAIATGTSPHILTLPVSPDIGQGQAVVVSYTDPTAGDDDVALEDAGGNETPSFATGSGGVPAVTNNSTVDLTGPALVSATVIFDGDQISLVFSEDLVIPASGIAAFLNTIAGSFSVTAAGSPLSVGRAIATGTSPHILTLPVSPDIGQGQAVVVSYTDPTAGDDDVALEDAGGNETPSFATGSGGVPAVTNNSTVDTAPALVAAPDGATVFTDELTLTYDEALDAGSVPAAGAYEVTATNGGVTTPLPVSAVAVDGTTVTLTLATPAVFGQVVTLTYTVPASNPLRDLFGNPAGALTNHPVTNETIVLPVVSIAAVHPKAAPLLADAAFRLTASPAPASDLAVTLSIAQAGAYLASTEQTVTIPAGQTSATGTFPIADDYTLASGGLTATVTGGGRLYVPAAAPANAATVQVVVVNPPIVAQWAENEYEVDEGQDRIATLTLKTAADVPKPRAAYAVKVFTTNHTAVAGDDYTAVSGTPPLTVVPGDWTADGAVFDASVSATVETVDDSILEGDERFRLQVSAVTGQAPLGLECPAGLRDLGGAGRCATDIVIDDDETLSVTGVTVTSTPAAGTTYLGGETIEFTATFTAPVTVTGTPTFAFTLGEAERQADYATGSESLELVFSYIVKAGETDTDGISWKANALALGGGTVRLTTTDADVEEDAALEHPAQPMLAGHRVDADPPGLVLPVTMQATTLRLLYDEALDPASRPAASAYTLVPGGNPSMVAIAGSTVTLTFATAPAEGATVRLAYTAPALNPVKDAAGNPAPAFTGLTVVRGPVVMSIDLEAPPTTIPAGLRYGFTEAQLSSNVLGLRGYKVHKMKAYGEGATLTFKVPFDRVVTVTGAPTLKLDLWGETRSARYVGGSGTDMLTFTWGPVLTGDNDFDGIEVKALVLAGASIVDAGNAESMFVAESFGGEHFPQHKVFGGFHEMWIDVEPEAEAVEGERFTFSVRRSIGESRDPESHYVLLGITDSAFPGVSASGRYEEAENGPGGRAVTFDQMASEGRRANTEESSLLVIPPVHEDTAGGRTMTIALLTTHVTVRNEHGELAHRIYMPRNLEGVTVPVRVSVSGRRAATVTVSMASTPRLKSISTAPTADTYGRRETIEIAVAASAAVEVVGDPVFRFTIGADPVRAAYDRVNSTATRLLFTYTVQAGDMGPDGISIGDGSTTFELDSNDRIRTVAQRIDIDRSHPAPGTLSGHKVDGSRIADNTAPALVAAPDGATVFTDELTLTYDEALDAGSVPAAGAYEVTATNGGVTTPLPVSAVAVDGTTVTLTLATPALLGETVTLTYTVPATNPLRDLFGNPAGALTNHPVTNETLVLVVLPVVSIAAVHAKAAPLLADAVFRLTASPAPAADLAVTLSIAQAGAYLASTAQTVTIAAGQTSATGTFPIANDDTLASGGLTATVTGGGRLYVPAAVPANAATVQVVVVDPPIVAQWAEDAYEVAEGKDATAALTLKTAAGVPKPRADYKVKVFTTNHSAVAGDDYTAVSGEVTVQPGDWTADGAVFAASVPATVETVGDSLLEGEERFRLQVSAVTGQAPLGLECPAGLRDLGGAGRCATVIAIDDDETLSVTAVTVTSTPAAGETYLGGETIAFTATFTASVTVTGAPTFAFTLGEAEREATYSSGSDRAELVFAYTVQAGEIDTDGISWSANALALDGGTVRLTTTVPNVEEDAALGHPAQREGLAGHRVDADPPGVESASLDGTRLELVYDEALDAGSVPAAGAYEVTATNGGVTTPLPVSAVAVDGSDGDADPGDAGGVRGDGDADLHGAGDEPAAGPLRQPRGGADEPSGDQRDDRAAGGVDRGGACEGGAVAGRCGVPADGVAGPGGGPRGHALDRAGGGVSREHGADRHDPGGRDFGDRDVPDCQRRHPGVRRPDRHGHGRRAPLRAGGGAGQRGDGPGGGGGPADRRAVGRGRIRGGRGPRQDCHADAEDGGGRAEAAGGVRRQGVHHEP